MKNFLCTCGQTLYFENTRCTACQRRIGYDPELCTLLALDPVYDEHGTLGECWRAADGGQLYQLCLNDIDYAVCNWLVSSPNMSYCLACSLNHIVPGVESRHRQLQKRQWWASMEQAKRRLLYTLMALGLPVHSKAEDPVSGLAFAFLEDQSSNPLVREKHVLTGHAEGLITVNLAEADNALREHARQRLGEPYRTLLGHFRHESGHYYFDRLIWRHEDLQTFRQLFGDERRDYDQAIAAYYGCQDNEERRPDMISAYAQAHPLEDWAECWAHYLHMIDTLETAAEYGVVVQTEAYSNWSQNIEACFAHWSQVSVMLNSLNRSMGLEDAYPFVLSAQTLNKLRFVHRMICPNSTPMQTGASVGTHP
ncbi:MAG: putative zinc-binding metallopeptidase [Gammaproteobacteria bacterium]|nr:putative zinc-binding metallopeptidase [Gammaproteobacteria bacterium]MDP2140074.1 putative zinc-binding metallopeptidase [Gammaproteobacteria bacterium]MDP2347636.1 putative zinc-binding metallopeptidase [Gammaproteobacteria bacterium]